MQEICCRVTGRVQMVMYRDFVQRSARLLGLTGFVRNRDDGSVEVVAQGAREVLEKLIQKLRRGSIFAKVKGVEVQWKEPHERFTSFTIVL